MKINESVVKLIKVHQNVKDVVKCGDQCSLDMEPGTCFACLAFDYNNLTKVCRTFSENPEDYPEAFINNQTNWMKYQWDD